MKNVLRRLVAIGLAFCSFSLMAQQINMLVAPELDVCQSGEVFSVEVLNNQSTALTGCTVRLIIPDGVAYVPGSIVSKGETSIEESDVSDLTNVLFTVGDLNAGSTLAFTVRLKALFQSIQYQNQGAAFRNSLQFQHDSGVENYLSNHYNILYGALTISHPESISHVVRKGQLYTQQIRIINGGYGALSDFELKDTHDTNVVRLVGTDKGVLSSGSIKFSAADFSQVGDGDELFERNEVIFVTQTFEVIGCGAAQSELQAFWGCDSESTGSNVLYPYTTVLQSLSASLVSSNESAYNGESFNRVITINNNSNDPMPEIVLITDYDENILSLESLSHGSVINGRITISDFTSVGDGDAFFEQGERLTLTQTWKMIGCESTSSDISIEWNCPTGVQSLSLGNVATEVLVNVPSVKRVASPAFNFCAMGEADRQELYLKNEGDGVAYDGMLTIKMPGSNYFTAIDEASFEVKIGANGSFLPFQANSSVNAGTSGSWACLSDLMTAPKRSVTLELPDMQPREEIWVRWNQYTCETDHCVKTHLTGWQYDLIYDGGCGVGTTRHLNQNGLKPLKNTSAFKVFAEGPSVLSHGQSGIYEFTFTSAGFSPGQTTANSYYEMDFDLPEGIQWSGDYNDIIFYNNNQELTPSLISVDEASGILKTRFDHPLPIGFGRAGIMLELSLDTNEVASGTSDFDSEVGMKVYYVPDGSCSESYRMALGCRNAFPTSIQCESTLTCDGMNIVNVAIERTSFGAPDNDRDGRKDETGVLNEQRIKKRRMMEGDTLRTLVKAICQGDNTYSFAYLDFSLLEAYVDKLSYLSNEVQVFDAVSQSNLPVFNAISTSTDSGVLLDLSTKGDFHAGDTIQVALYHKVEANVGPVLANVRATLDMYGAFNANPQETDQYRCKKRSGYFTLIGHYFKTSGRGYATVTKCSERIHQKFYFGLGDYNYAGGDLFPYEYRNWAHLDSVKVELPAGYKVIRLDMYQNRTRYQNNSKRETINNLPFSQYNTSFDSNYMLANLSSAYSINGDGPIEYSDDGFEGRLTIHLEPICKVVPINTYEPLVWTYYLRYAERLGGGQVGDTHPYYDQVRYRRGNLKISTDLQTMVGNGPTVSWNVSVKNNGSATAGNGFLYFSSPSTYLSDFVLFDENGDTVSSAGGIYQLGDYAIGQSKNYVVCAKYSSCSPDYLVIYTGYDCQGYPENQGHYFCGKDEFSLYIEPNPSELQSRIRGYGQQACSPSANVEVEFSSVKLAHVRDVKVTLKALSQNNVSIRAGSSMVLYPEAGEFSDIEDPIQQGNDFVFAHDQMYLPETLKGVESTDSNTAFLRFTVDLGADFSIGDFVQADISAKRVCGDSLPIVSLFFDPYAIYEQNVLAGLDDVEDNWGMAWGDYDVDGFPDLFVTNYDRNKPNLLYRNKGNGTFEKVTTGSVVTDLASSLAASWGDYDNDGDPDLFVANNIGSTNFLYRNDGGSFTKITDDPIVNYNSYAHSCSWVDYNNDGFLDMYIGDYFPTNQNALYENQGDGTFKRITASVITQNASHSIATAWADFDNDGNQDLFVANSHGENNQLYRNIGNGIFEEITIGEIVSDSMNSVGASWGDYDNDCWPDLFVTNSTPTQPNLLYHNNGDGSFTRVLTGEIATDKGSSHGSSWCDINNDGFLDLLVTNDNNEENFLYVNQGGGVFRKVSNGITESAGNTFGIGTADFDRDGDPDFFMATHKDNATGANASNLFFENQRGNCSGKLCLTLIGTNSNRSAIGARIEVLANINGEPVWQSRQLSGQTGGGLGSQNELRQLIGLGDAALADSVIIHWPSGYRQELINVVSDTCMTIIEEDGAYLRTVAYLDQNQNCIKDSNEYNLPDMEMLLLGENTQLTIFSNSKGEYISSVRPGSYQVEGRVKNDWFSDCLDSAELTQIGDTVNLFVPFYKLCSYADLHIAMATTVVRPGFDVDYQVVIENKGVARANDVNLTVLLPEGFEALNAMPEWNGLEANQLFWNLDSLLIGEQREIVLTLNASTDIVIGEEIVVTGNVQSAEGDCDASDNLMAFSQTIVGSIDPNEIHVFPRGLGDQHYIKSDQVLTYRILFQNKGTYEATYVTIYDTLNSFLDLNTISNVVMSHEGQMEYDSAGVMKWSFVDIGLPTEDDDEEGSNGYVQFTITPKKSIPQGTVIKNTAMIYFDYNEPIRTNTVWNTVIDEVFGSDEGVFVRMYPNPTSDVFVASLSPQQLIRSVRVTDITGKLVMQKRYTSDTRKISIQQDWEEGIYFVELTNIRGRKFTDRLVVQSSSISR